ncbi:hypothetical protein C8Q73DRAFT_435743 [Cubamyces lactineus]|nr:hypothetical protein C8Q73DRAFT_435743 [Cubamyces lactineus]
MPALGYFAFPPSGSPPPNSGQYDVYPADMPRSGENVEQGQHATQCRQADHQEADDTRKRQRLEFEHDLALKSEMEYVRMGFSIRDRFGRVDRVRTERIRAEIHLRDALARLIQQWETYETRWRNLLASNTPVTFADIPWPSPDSPSSVDDIRPESIIQFFLDSLRVPGNTSSESDRLRSALLRWHPDKMSAVLSRTVDLELDSVREGVNIVFRALHARMNFVECPQQKDRAFDP